jgi:hypothetical protein
MGNSWPSKPISLWKSISSLYLRTRQTTGPDDSAPCSYEGSCAAFSSTQIVVGSEIGMEHLSQCPFTWWRNEDE